MVGGGGWVAVVETHFSVKLEPQAEQLIFMYLIEKDNRITLRLSMFQHWV